MLVADIDSRLEELAHHGIQEVFKTLHPSVRPTQTGLEITRGREATDLPEPGRGLILMPNAFVWPTTLVLNIAPSRLLGRTRAQILGQPDVPMTTTQLACALGPGWVRSSWRGRDPRAWL